MDNDAERRTVEQCYRTNKTLVNPIIDWTDDDVWEYIRTNNLPYCKLYDEGWKRLGCVGCPLGNYSSQRREFARWPQYQGLYINAFDEMLKTRSAAGKNDKDGNGYWTTPENVFRWWTGQFPKKDKAQTSLFDNNKTEVDCHDDPK